MNDHPYATRLYIFLAGVAGAVTSLSMMQWRSMTWSERLMTIFVGTAFSMFAMPWIAADWARIDITNLRAICALTYLGGTGANILIPVIIRRFKRQLDGRDVA